MEWAERADRLMPRVRVDIYLEHGGRDVPARSGYGLALPSNAHAAGADPLSRLGQRDLRDSGIEIGLTSHAALSDTLAEPLRYGPIKHNVSYCQTRLPSRAIPTGGGHKVQPSP